MSNWFGSYLLVLLALLFSRNAAAQLEFTMSDTTVTECKGILFDNGGEGSDYLHNSNTAFTICLEAPGQLTLGFEFLCIEVGFDSLSFHLGPTSTSPQVGPAYAGTTIPPPVTISQGCLTVNFVSDANVACDGWKAQWTTEVVPPVPPQINAILPSPACSTTTAQISLSKPVACDSVYAAAFTFEGAEDQQVIQALPVSCPGDSTQLVNLTLSPGINSGGPYSVGFTTNYLDACDSLWTFTTTDSVYISDCPIVVTLLPDRDSICAGECTKIRVEVSGGNGIYTYSWNNSLPAEPDSQSVCPVVNTTYTLTVDDTSPASPATATTSITVFQPASVPSASAHCQSEPAFNLTANPGGGWWFGSGITDSTAGTFTGDSAQAGLNLVSYFLPITSTFGCTSQVAVTLRPIDAGYPDAACPGTPAFQLTGFTPSGGAWSGTGINPEGIFDPDSIGQFTVTYSVNGCTDQRVINVDTLSAAPVMTDSLCQSAASIRYELSPFGGRWSGDGIVDSLFGTFDPGEAQGGRHTITYALYGCSQQIDVVVKPIFAGWNQSACPTQSSFLLPDFYPSGGFWSGNGIVTPETGLFNPGFNAAGDFETELIYSLTNGCTDTLTMYVYKTTITNDTLVFCSNAEQLILSGDNMGSYPWGGIWTGAGVIPGNDPDSSAFQPELAPNGVSFLYYSNNTCIDSATVFVLREIIQPLPSVCSENLPFPVQLPPFVTGGSFSGAGISDPSAGIFDPALAGAGMHELIYESPSGCKDTVVQEVIPFAEASIDFRGSRTICFMDTLIEVGLLPAAGLLSGSGIVDSVHFNPAVADAGDHWLYYSTGTGFCQSIDSVMITVPPRVSYALTVSNDSLCAGEYAALNVNAFGGNGNIISYTWSNGLQPQSQQIVSPLLSTNYTLLVTDGCTVIKDTISIFVASAVKFTITTSDTACYGEPSFLVIDGLDGQVYDVYWQNEHSTTGKSLSGNASFSYTATVRDSTSGCSVDTLITVPGYPLVKAQFIINPDLECIPANQRTLNVIDLSTGASSGMWNFGDGTVIPFTPGENPEHEYILQGEYSISLEVSDSNGCRDTSAQSVCLEDPLKLYVPNAFTVNEDGLNEVFLAKGSGIKYFNMWIYDRRGVVIFESHDIQVGWDGRYMGNIVPIGVYAWVIELQWTSNSRFESAGTFTLLR